MVTYCEDPCPTGKKMIFKVTNFKVMVTTVARNIINLVLQGAWGSLLLIINHSLIIGLKHYQRVW